jgi:hypothetical protein
MFVFRRYDFHNTGANSRVNGWQPSAAETQIIWRIYRHLQSTKHPELHSRSICIFGLASILLGVGFIISTILLVTSTVLKLQYASGHRKGDGLDLLDPYAYRDVLALDSAFGGMLQLMVLVADGLMVSLG